MPAALCVGVALAIFGAVLYPGPGSHLPYGVYLNVLLGALGVAAALLAPDVLQRQRRAVRVVVLLSLLLVLNSWISVLPEAGMPAALALSAAPLGLLFAWCLYDRGLDVLWMGLWLVIGLVVAGSIWLDWLLGAARASGLVEDPNLAARLSNLLSLAAIGVAVASERRWLRWAGVFVAVAGASAVVLTASRAGLMCWLGGWAMIMFAGWRGRWPLSGLFAPLAALVLAAMFLGVSPPARQGVVADVIERDVDTRASMWEAGVDQWLNAPWPEKITGFGLQSFHRTYAPLRGLDGEAAGTSAHSDLVQALHDGGLLLFLALVLFLILLLVQYRRLTSGAETAGSRARFAVGSLAGVSAVAVHGSLVSFFMYVPALMLLIGMALGAVLWRPPRGFRIHVTASTRIFASWLGACWLAALSVMSVDALTAALILGHPGLPFARDIRSDPQALERALQLTARLNPSRATPHIGLAEVHRALAAGAGGRRSPAIDRRASARAAVGHYQAGLQRDARDPGANARFASFLLERRDVLGDPPLSLVGHLAGQALALDRADPGGYRATLALLQATGDADGQYRFLRDEFLPWQRILWLRDPELHSRWIGLLYTEAKARGDSQLAQTCAAVIADSRGRLAAGRSSLRGRLGL